MGLVNFLPTRLAFLGYAEFVDASGDHCFWFSSGKADEEGFLWKAQPMSEVRENLCFPSNASLAIATFGFKNYHGIRSGLNDQVFAKLNVRANRDNNGSADTAFETSCPQLCVPQWGFVSKRAHGLMIFQSDTLRESRSPSLSRPGGGLRELRLHPFHQ